MATFEVTGIGPGRPVEAMTTHPEGGVAAALAAAAVLFPGRHAEHVRTGTWAEPGGYDEAHVLLATYGPVAAMLGPIGTDAVAPEGSGRYVFAYQSVSMAYVVEVDAGPVHRWIGVAPGSAIPDEGDPLPFEVAYWAGEHDEYPGEEPAFDADAWGSAAMLWMFGWDPAGESPGPFDPATQPLHALRFG